MKTPLPQSRHEALAGELSSLLAQVQRMRIRLAGDGPMVTHRIWKAEMQIRNAIAEFHSEPDIDAGASYCNRGQNGRQIEAGRRYGKNQSSSARFHSEQQPNYKTRLEAKRDPVVVK